MSDPTNDGWPGDATEPALGLVDAVMAETIGMAMHNAVAAQNNMRMMGAAAVTAACVRMIKAAGGPPPSKVLTPIVPTPIQPPLLTDSGGGSRTGAGAKAPSP